MNAIMWGQVLIPTLLLWTNTGGTRRLGTLYLRQIDRQNDISIYISIFLILLRNNIGGISRLGTLYLKNIDKIICLNAVIVIKNQCRREQDIEYRQTDRQIETQLEPNFHALYQHGKFKETDSFVQILINIKECINMDRISPAFPGILPVSLRSIHRGIFCTRFIFFPCCKFFIFFSPSFFQQGRG